MSSPSRVFETPSINRRLLAAAALLACAPAGPAAGQAPGAAPSAVSADVVVTAEAVPEPAATLGVAATVVTAAEIERSRATTVAELLRRVPGLDLVQSGGAGGVTSLFLRGAGSTQTLVLVDGVRLNSPHFGGVDLSTLSTANVERIEVVRGPFSALYGSEAIGGVVQVVTRRGAGDGLSGRASFGAGSRDAREGVVTAALGEGPVSVSAGFRRTLEDGGLPNESFAATSLSAAVDVAVSADLKAGVAVRRESSRTGIPFSGATATPSRSTTADQTIVSVPLSIGLGAGTTLEAAATFGEDRPTYEDPDDPWGYTRSETRARRAGGRLVVSRASGPNRLSAGADYERSSVTSEDSYGVSLDDAVTRTWALFVEDRLELAGDRLVVTAGVRRDDHSAYGASTNPRVTLAFRPAPSLKLRAAAGTAFRSPTTGELYYPFSGNPQLEPERSASYEAGGELSLAPGLVAEATGFFTDVRDLIQYDFAAQRNVNVGRARSRGVELVLRGDLTAALVARASYTYLDAEDRDTGLPLLRRPRHRAAVTLGASLRGLEADVTGLYVGARDDVDAQTFARVTSPSYFRLDVSAALPHLLGPVGPFVRVTNLLGEEYTEVAGYPSPGRRFLVGLDASF